MAIKTDKLVDAKTNKSVNLSQLVTFEDGKFLSLDGKITKTTDTIVNSIGDFPIVFGVMKHFSHYGRNVNHTTSQFASDNSSYVDEMLLGKLDFKLPRGIVYPDWVNGRFVYKESFKFTTCSHYYNYADKAISIMFLKNDEGHSKSFNLSIGGTNSSHSSSYNYACVYTITPNATNGNTVSSVSISRPYRYTSNTGSFGTNVSITVPANKTIAVVYINPAYYHTNDGGYTFYHTHELYNLKNVFNAGLTIDKERTLKCLGGLNSAPQDIWN